MATVKRSQHLDRGWLGIIVISAATILAFIALFEFRVRSGFYNFNDRMGQIVEEKIHPERPNVLLRSHYTGVSAIDYALRYMVAIHLPSIAGFVELISLWTFLYSALGGAVGLPLWFVTSLRHSTRKDLYGSSSTQLPVPYARALLPAHILGYFCSMVAVLIPLDDSTLSKTQMFIAIWIVSPFTINILLAIFTKIFEFFPDKENEAASTSDAFLVKLLYALSFFSSAAAHIVLLYLSTRAQWSFTDVFFPRMGLMAGSTSEMVYYTFVLDFAIMFSVALASAFVVLIDLRTMGRSSQSPITTAVGMMLATFLIGPAATIMAVWWWQEDKIRQLEKDVSKHE